MSSFLSRFPPAFTRRLRRGAVANKADAAANNMNLCIPLALQKADDQRKAAETEANKQAATQENSNFLQSFFDGQVGGGSAR